MTLGGILDYDGGPDKLFIHHEPSDESFEMQIVWTRPIMPRWMRDTKP